MFLNAIKLRKPVRGVNTCYFVFESATNQYKTQEMRDISLDRYAHVLEFVPDLYMTQKCVIKLLVIILLQCNLFLNVKRFQGRRKLFYGGGLSKNIGRHG